MTAPKNTPWGPVQTRYPIAPGICWVSTAGHGGLMITAEQADRLLTTEARGAGEVFDGWLCYEEDCLYAVALYEHPEWAKAGALDPAKPSDQVKTEAWHALSAWNPEYLLARGIEPEAERYAHAKLRAERDRRRAVQDPDLIVSAVMACSFWPSIPAGAVQVWTADGARHLVTPESYAARSTRGGLNLLSACVPFRTA